MAIHNRKSGTTYLSLLRGGAARISAERRPWVENAWRQKRYLEQEYVRYLEDCEAAGIAPELTLRNVETLAPGGRDSAGRPFCPAPPNYFSRPSVRTIET